MPPVDSTSAPLRVARIITRLNVGGPAIQAIEMSARLESAGCRTLLIHGRLGPGEGDMRYLIPDDRRFDVAFVPALRREIAPAADLVAFARVFQLLSGFRPAIVHTHMAKAGTIGRAAALLYNATIGRRAPARLVHTYHGHVLEGYFSVWMTHGLMATERALGRRTHALVAVSSIIRRELLEQYRIGTPALFNVVPLGLDLAPFLSIGPTDRLAARAALGLDSRARVAALVGRLTAIKQPHLFIDAAERIASSDPYARFLVAGGGDLEAPVRAAIDGRGLSERVRFLGWQRDVAKIYAASDVVAITSLNEGTPVALIEGMAAGVPGVCFAVGGIPDVLVAPDQGVLVREGDVDALVTAIQQLFDNDQRRAQMGARARASVAQRYSVDRLAGDLGRLYRQLVG